jgi:hypothetical protein
MAPETASVDPAMTATNTRGRRMFHTTSCFRPISGNSPPSRKAFHASGSNTIPASNTAVHASRNVMEKTPLLTCTTPASTVTAELPRQNNRSGLVSHPCRSPRVVFEVAWEPAILILGLPKPWVIRFDFTAPAGRVSGAAAHSVVHVKQVVPGTATHPGVHSQQAPVVRSLSSM